MYGYINAPPIMCDAGRRPLHYRSAIFVSASLRVLRLHDGVLFLGAAASKRFIFSSANASVFSTVCSAS